MKTVDHIAVLVENLDVSQEWYETNCGAKLIFEDYKYKRMAMGNVTVALIDKEHYQYNHIGILVENYRDLPSDKGESFGYAFPKDGKSITSVGNLYSDIITP